jgi:hypothetical protein
MSRMPVIEGLILEKTSDGRYRRQGTFDAHDVPAFNKLSEQTVTIV